FELLGILVEHPRQVFSRDQLFELVWGAFGDRSAVAVYIGRLRQKIEPDPARPRYIVTVWGAGYRLDPGSRSAGRRAASGRFSSAPSSSCCWCRRLRPAPPG